MEASTPSKTLSSNNPYRRILEARKTEQLIDFGEEESVPRSLRREDTDEDDDIFGLKRKDQKVVTLQLQRGEESDIFQIEPSDLITVRPPSSGNSSSSSRSKYNGPAYSLAPTEEDANDRVEVSETETEANEYSTEPPTTPEPSTPSDPNMVACEDCNEVGLNRLFCNVCSANFCRMCWELQLPHRKKLLDPHGNPHESTDQVLAQRIRESLEPQVDEQRQDELHRRDENTAWFGVVRDMVDGRIFEDYGRFASLMAESQEGHSRPRYPGIVSFVGQTGAGKSTLIKLLIELHYQGKRRFPAPVVGSIRCHHSSPTTGDVHLYSDPHSQFSDYPLAYVDVEGLEGGERTPIGALKAGKNRLSLGSRDSFHGKIRKGSSLRRKLHHTSEREITWATTTERKTREFTVLNLYPRILYTFSDVVVFVLKNPKTIENVVERLLIWASQAIEKSSNQPVLPHAIIALNAMPNGIDALNWDVTHATRILLDSINSNFDTNSKFSRFVRFWKERGREVSSIRELLMSYYSNIRVVCIPGNGRPNLISEQIKRLYGEINSAVETSRENKRSLRMLLSTVDIQPYFQCAFDHFACDLDTPFDFVQASFANNPIPLDFGGNILKLALSIMNSDWWKERKSDDARQIIRKLSRLIASCIMLDSARHKTCGTAENIFPEYLTPLDNFLDDFRNRHWPCEFQSTRGVRCVNVKSGHAKGHQLKNGRVISGAYQSRCEGEGYRTAFRNDVFKELRQMLFILRTKGSQPSTEVEFATQIHKDHVLGPFFVDVGGADKYSSLSTCLSCLVGIAEHALPCGHLMCTACLAGYGIPGKTFVEIRTCPLHEAEIIKLNLPWRVYVKPPSAGVRVLSLDGGGIRSVIQLEILRQVEQALGGQLPIQAFFDLIVGTSTGGIVALGLGAKNWRLKDCANFFYEICYGAFTRRKLTVKSVMRSYYQSKHETQPLQNALMAAFSAEEPLFGGLRNFRNTAYKVAVTSTLTAGKPAVLASYNRRDGSTDCSYAFQRPENQAHELKMWEAARATTAATRYFRPFSHSASKQEYVDGAIHHNNPIHVADAERRLIWPDAENSQPDIILSLGAGYAAADHAPPMKPLRSQTGLALPSPQRKKGASGKVESYRSCEQIWEDFLNVHVPIRERQRYVRLNVDLTPDAESTPPKFDDVSAMVRMEDMAREAMTNTPGKEMIRDIADQLIATTFYFEKSGIEEKEGENGFIVTGTINCRWAQWAPASAETEELGELFRDLERARGGNRSSDWNWSPFFIVRERYKEGEAEVYEITSDVIECMISKRRFNMGAQLRIPVSSAMSTTEILLCLDGRPVGGGAECAGKSFHISGFPRDLLREDERRKGMRQDRPSASQNWRKKSVDSGSSKDTWRSPTLGYSNILESTIEVEKSMQDIKLQPPPTAKKRRFRGRVNAATFGSATSKSMKAERKRSVLDVDSADDADGEAEIDIPGEPITGRNANTNNAFQQYSGAAGGAMSPYTETRTTRLYTETSERIDVLRTEELVRLGQGGSG